MTLQTDDWQKQYARPNDAWQCSLPQSSSCGGQGTHLPDAGECTPVPSLRFQRGIFSFACTAMIAGLLLACWNSPVRNEFLAPGPLSRGHAQILVGAGTNRCSTCHGAGDSTLGSWIQDAVSGGKHIPISQSSLCMDCHDKSLSREFALQAHNMAPQALQQITETATVYRSQDRGNDPRNAYGELACATCHREHHGTDFNLTALTDQQCQTCHANYVHSFEQDHPEFNNWPYARRTGIAFDHVSHGIKHFAEKQESFDCRQCHVDDAQGIVKTVASFEVSCAKCHEAGITGNQATTWTLLQIPMLDVESLQESGYSIGSWPEYCTGDFDGQLPPAMKLLLMSDRQAAAVLERREPDFQFADLNPGNLDDLDDAATLAWAIKRLMFDLTIKGELEIRERVASSLNQPNAARDWTGLTWGLNRSVFAEAQREWLPDLLAEMTARDAGLGFGPDPSVNSIFARPGMQEEDKLVENPLAEVYRDREIPGDQPATASAPDATMMLHQQSTETNEPARAPITNSAPGSGPGGALILNPHTSAKNRSNAMQEIPGDTLVENPLKFIAGSDPAAPGSAPTTSLPEVAIAPPVSPTPPVTIAQPDIESRIRAALDRVENFQGNGWYRDTSQFSISYRVSAHIDPLIKSWTDLAMQHRQAPAINESNLFDQLNSPLAAGQCRSCHTAESDTSGALTVNWTPRYRDTTVRGFTRFSHRPHDTQTVLQDCTSCHKMDESRVNHHVFAALDATAYLSNFLPISKSECAACHRPGGAPSGCVDCHNYHIGSKVQSEPSQ